MIIEGFKAALSLLIIGTPLLALAFYFENKNYPLFKTLRFLVTGLFVTAGIVCLFIGLWIMWVYI